MMKRSVDQEDTIERKRVCTESVASSEQEKSRPSLVPEYLRDSDFYKSLNIEDDEEFDVSVICMKNNMNVETLQDACYLLETLRFWGSTASVAPVVQLAISQPLDAIKSELSAFEEEFPFLKSLFYILDERNPGKKRMEAAMELGMLEVVQHLDKTMDEYTIHAIGLAAAGGHMDCLAHALHSTVEEAFLEGFQVYHGALKCGHLDCVKLLDQHPQFALARYVELANYCWRQKSLCTIAAKYGQLESLRFLHKRGCELRSCLMPAVEGGNMACLQYVVRKCGRNLGDISRACAHAVLYGRFDCLKYLHEHRFPIYRKSCIIAATVGSADCLSYAYQHYVKPLGWRQFGHAAGDPIRFIPFHPNISSRHNGDDRSGASDTTESSMFLSSVNSKESISNEVEEGGGGTEEQKQNSEDEDETEWRANRHAEPGSVGQSRMPKEVCTEAAQVGSVACLQFFLENGGEWDFLTIHAAALNDHLDSLQYACENGCPFVPQDKKEQDRYAFDTSQGSKEYMRRFKVSHGPRHLAELVAQREHWDCVQYLIVHYPTLTTGLSTVLHQHGKQELLELAVGHGCEVSLDVAVCYASAGDLDRLKFAFDHHCSRATKIPSILAAAGNLEGLKYAFKRGCSPSADVCVAAARAGHLDCLQYAREHGCKWNKEVCLVAARNNHLDCVKYAREHGCPWDSRVYWTAAKKGFQDIVQYAKDNNCPQELCFD